MDDSGAYTDIDYTQIVEGTTLDKDPQFHLVADSLILGLLLRLLV